MICDYAGYDYKKEFWEKADRAYEDACERRTLTKLLKKVPRADTLLDAGCGFGRLFPTYQPFGDQILLMDYALNMLQQAKSELPKSVHYVSGNLMALPFQSETVNTVVSIRTLHHVTRPEDFFSDVARILKPGGAFIMEIPNQRHILNILRFLSGRLKQNPFSKTPIRYRDAFINFNPSAIYPLLQQAGFQIAAKRSTSFFRHRFFKKWLPTSLLVGLDSFFQALFSPLSLTPSLYILCRKEL